jgi:sugar phosphate isomerase/epimerase
MPAVGERYEVSLHCARCRRTTLHLVTAGAGGVSRVTCITCGRAQAVHTLQFMEQYTESVMRRLLAKPFDMTTEFMRSPRDFIASFPGRMMTKPFRVAAELRATMDIIRPRRSRAAPPRSTVPPVIGDLPAIRRRSQVLLSAPLLWAHTTTEILDIAHELGYDGVELWAYQLLREGGDPPALAARIRELGLAVTVHLLSWDLNVTSRVEAIASASMDALHRSVDLAAALGTSLIVMHPGHTTAPHDDGEPYWPVLVAVVREIADHAADLQMRVGVEHMEARQTEFVILPEQANRLVDEVGRPNVGTVLDVAHIPWGQDEVEFITRLDRVIHVHLSDADETRLHLPLGQGERDLVRVLGALHRYRGAIALEGFSISAGVELARWNKAQFEELWRASVEDAQASARA